MRRNSSLAGRTSVVRSSPTGPANRRGPPTRRAMMADVKEEKRVAAALARHSLRLLAGAVAALAVVATFLGIEHAIAAALMIFGAAALAFRP